VPPERSLGSPGGDVALAPQGGGTGRWTQAMALPSGTVTLLFSDIEGSTRLLEQLGERYSDVLDEHRGIVRGAIAEHGGHEIRTEGDAFFVAFSRAGDAVRAALAVQRRLGAREWPNGVALRVRIGLHTGEPRLVGEDYVGMDVHCAARICSSAHGGQILVSETTEKVVVGQAIEGMNLRCLGEHRLKDLSRPMRLYQVTVSGLIADFPPLRGLVNVPTGLDGDWAAQGFSGGDGASTNLPRQLTSFVGRERELTELEGMLTRTRLLTLRGPGGCGKTRLALELGRANVDEFEDGVWLVELAPITDAELVVQQAATALGLELRSTRDPVDVLAEQIGEHGLLLMLDNCEHVIGVCARMVDGLLRACPALKVLATSREALRVQGEVVWRVPPLLLPDPGSKLAIDEVARVEAVQLFCERAAAVAGAFALAADNVGAVADICLRLDGMPLALELAAARTAILAPTQIAERLHDSLGLLTAGSRTGVTRQKTLRATLQWSYDLLSEPERLIFRRLGAFSGSFGIDAVEGVCAGDDLPASGAIELLGGLVEKSLVQVEPMPGEHRYRLLETMREYARELLIEAGERDEFECRHRGWFLALAEAEDPTPTGGCGRPGWLERDHDNLRAALASALAHHPPTALRIAVALCWFWVARGYFSEGARWIEQALARETEPTELRARALAATAILSARRGVWERRMPLLAESIEIRRALGDPARLARGLRELGDHLAVYSDHDAADRAYRKAMEVCAALDDVGEPAGVLLGQGMLAYFRGDLSDSRERFEECIALLEAAEDVDVAPFWAVGTAIVITPEGRDGALRCFFEGTSLVARTVGRRVGIAYALCNMATSWRRSGEYEHAREALEHGLAIFRDCDDPEGIAQALHALGNLARSTGEFDLGRERLDEALMLRREFGNRRDIGATLSSLGLLAVRSGDHARGRALLAEARALYTRTEDGPGLAGIALNLGCVELDHADPERACALLAQSAAMWDEQHAPWVRSWVLMVFLAAVLAIGDSDTANATIAEVRGAFEQLGEKDGLVRVAEVRVDAGRC
jgi:predicted ATPase/class 3 adenylate cyclase